MIARYFDRPEKIDHMLSFSSSYCSEEEWLGLIKAKQDFLENGIDPRLSPCVSIELAESWLRSRNYGVNPDIIFNPPLLPAEEIEQVLKKNNRLITLSKSVLEPFLKLASPSSYQISLFDKNGVIILLEGISKSPSGIQENKYKVGMIFNEEVIGTNVYSLCKIYSQPVQLLAPEVYLNTGEFNIVSAANIVDENGELAGVLVYRQINQQLTEKPWLQDYQDLRMQTLGLITAMAQSIEAQLKLKRSYDLIETSHNMLEVTLDFIGEGIIAINLYGEIININGEGKLILGLTDDDKNVNVKQFLSHESKIMDFVRSNNTNEFYDEMLHLSDGSTRSFAISIRPIKNRIGSEAVAAVLRFSETKKLNAVAARRVGSIARYSFNDIIGECSGMYEAKMMANRFAVSTESILILGENGTGKELFAQSIHNKYRPNQPFVALNCAALPRNLIESELFGYESGAFTGADRNGRPGKIELANKGTLFLDEIGDMPYEIQAVLLRVIEDKQVMRIGSNRYQTVDFRVITATNRNLRQMVKEKLFREDLYYRISILTLEIPPLRMRGSDIILLAEYFIVNYCKRMKWPAPEINERVKKYISEYEWPGNVRQLENAMIYACNVTENRSIDLHNLPHEIFETDLLLKNDEVIITPEPQLYDASTLKEMEKEMLQNLLQETDNNVFQAAKLMGVSRSTLYRKLNRYHIKF